MIRQIIIALFTIAFCISAPAYPDSDPLPSWNEGVSKANILEFVERVGTEASPDFVPPEKRIATFDNDGTLWSEQPMYFQVIFALDRIRMMAPDHPEWAGQSAALKAAMAGDMKSVLAMGEKGLVEILAASHTGITESEFSQIVTEWIDSSRHPRFDRRYTELIYQPMLDPRRHKKGLEGDISVRKGRLNRREGATPTDCCKRFCRSGAPEALNQRGCQDLFVAAAISACIAFRVSSVNQLSRVESLPDSIVLFMLSSVRARSCDLTLA